MKRDLVVVGNGMGGARFLEELLLRGGGARFRITVFGDEPQGNYNRVLLSSVLSGEHRASDIVLNPLSWYRAHGIELRAGVRAASLDREGRRVLGSDGSTARYDELVLATGSSPFLPPIPGLRGPSGALVEGAFVLRTLADCAALLDASPRARCAAVLGGGLLGLETARALQRACPEVHVVQRAPQLMEQQLDPAASRLLEAALSQSGLRLHLATFTAQVLGGARVEGLRFADGGTLACDLLVVAAGIRPNVELARQAGLPVERGILVGDDLAVPGCGAISAVGECAQHRGVSYGLVGPVWEQAAALAARLSGARAGATYRGSRVATRLQVAGVELSVMGERAACAPGDEELVFTDAGRGIYKKLVVRAGRLVGAALLGDPAAAGGLLPLFDRGVVLPEPRGALLFPAQAGRGRAVAGLDELPDEARICDCNAVSKGAIARAARAGCDSLEAICAATRAGTGCGTCRPRVEELLRALAREGRRRSAA